MSYIPRGGKKDLALACRLPTMVLATECQAVGVGKWPIRRHKSPSVSTLFFSFSFLFSLSLYLSFWAFIPSSNPSSETYITRKRGQPPSHRGLDSTDPRWPCARSSSKPASVTSHSSQDKPIVPGPSKKKSQAGHEDQLTVPRMAGQSPAYRMASCGGVRMPDHGPRLSPRIWPRRLGSPPRQHRCQCTYEWDMFFSFSSSPAGDASTFFLFLSFSRNSCLLKRTYKSEPAGPLAVPR